MTTIYFVRHAHSPWVPNREAERPLSDDGERAAERVADRLSDVAFDAVLTSPFERARRTVAPIADRRGLDLRVVEGFRERTLTDGPAEDWGETFESAVDAVWADWSFAWPDAESNREAQARGVDAVESILADHAGETVAVGIHGQLLTVTLNRYDDRFDFEFWRDELTTPDVYEVRFADGTLRSVERRYRRSAE